MADTSAPLSEVSVANMAATVLADASLNSLDDPSPLGRFMAREFGYTRDEVLQLFPWDFAKARAAIPKTADAPAFGWKYKFVKPADCIKLLPVTADGSLNGPPIDYTVEGDEILTDYSVGGSTLYVRYVRRQTNMAKWSPLAARLLGARLAVMASLRITGKQGYYDRAKAGYDVALFDAQRVHSLDGGTPESIDNERFLENTRGVYTPVPQFAWNLFNN